MGCCQTEIFPCIIAVLFLDSWYSLDEGTMQGKKVAINKLFYNVTLEQLVPQDHLLRRIQEVLDFDFLYATTRTYYSAM